MSSEDDLQQLLLETFGEEAKEQVQALNADLLALEKDPPEAEAKDLLTDAFRQAHNLKGASRTVGQEQIGGIAHRLETLFSRLQDGTLAVDPANFDVIYRSLDAISELVSAIGGSPASDLDLDELEQSLEAAAGDEPAVAVSAPSAEGGLPVSAAAPTAGDAGPSTAVAAAVQKVASPADETIRIATSKLDALMAQVGELLTIRTSEEQRRADVREAIQDLDALRVPGDGARELKDRLEVLRRMLESDGRRLAQITDVLQDDVRRARMLPVAMVFDPLPRAARDLSRELGKDVELRIEGGDTEVDRSVLEQLRAPLNHLVRNAIDHGIEDGDTRAANGKPPRGSVLVRAEQRGGTLLIEISDDGAGIDLNAVREQAIQRDLIAADAALSDEELRWLIFRPGFSTRSQVSDVSGRGVGMDVVREQVERLHGLIEVESSPGEGSRFSLHLPLSIATTRCLVVRAGGQLFGIPINNLDRIVSVSPAEIGQTQGREAIRVDGRPMALARLADSLGLAGADEPDGARPAVVLGTAQRRVAFLVDELVSAQEVAIKRLPEPLRRVRHVAGVSILGSGEILTVLNAADLLASAGRSQLASAAHADETTPVTLPVLVVDDSITTRTLEKNLLEAAGYDVQTASDGVEAWEMLKRERYSLVVSDVQMPRLDGVGLTERVRADERLGDLPLVLVTSLGSDEDRKRGFDAGADAYIVKGSFDQDQLLDTVRRLI